jgi:hypothetical protein
MYQNGGNITNDPIIYHIYHLATMATTLTLTGIDLTTHGPLSTPPGLARKNSHSYSRTGSGQNSLGLDPFYLNLSRTFTK